MTTETLTAFFGWMTVLNFALLIFSTVMLIALRDWIAEIHDSLLKVEKADLHRTYFSYLALYKVLILVFCLVPWLALRLI